MYSVVFVEDEVDLCELYKERFSSSTVVVNCFSDQNAAEEFLSKEVVSLVFVDFRMPQGSGIEFRKRLPKDLPCFLITGEFLKDKPEGFIDVLEKPLSQDMFDAVLGSFGRSRPEERQDPYYSLFENMAQEVHIWKVEKDSRGRIKTWRLVNANAAALKSWQKKIEEVIGRTTEEIFPNSRPVELFLPIVEKIFAEGKPVRWQQFFKDTDQLLQMVSIPCGECFLSVGEMAPTNGL